MSTTTLINPHDSDNIETIIAELDKIFSNQYPIRNEDDNGIKAINLSNLLFILNEQLTKFRRDHMRWTNVSLDNIINGILFIKTDILSVISSVILDENAITIEERNMLLTNFRNKVTNIEAQAAILAADISPQLKEPVKKVFLVTSYIKRAGIPEIDTKLKRSTDDDEIKIKGYFDLSYIAVRDTYFTEHRKITPMLDKIEKIEFNLDELITDISNIMATREKEVKIIIGYTLFQYLEMQYPHPVLEKNPNRNCIIPIGIPGSGKSSLTKIIDSTYVNCDADNIRDVIINSLLHYYFVHENKSPKIPTSDEATEMWMSDTDKFNKWTNAYTSFIELFHNYILFGFKNFPKVKGCAKGIEAYCQPLIVYNEDSLFIPQAIDIFLLFCKYRNLNFIYDAANTDAEFRYSLMMRCYLMGNYRNFQIWPLITQYHDIIKHIKDRNETNIRQTTI